MHIIIIK